MNSKNYYIYIATNHPRNTVLYTGVTNKLYDRSFQHKEKLIEHSFSAKYNINRIVYYELFSDVNSAIAREKQIKSGSRKKKIELIESINLEWNDIILQPHDMLE